MPVHDWTRVEAGIFHHFYLCWIAEISEALNDGVLSGDYYALAEQFASQFGPDVLTLHAPLDDESSDTEIAPSAADGTGLLLAPPNASRVGESEMDHYRRKQNVVSIRHVSGDRIVALVEIVSPGNKGGRKHFRSFIEKTAAFLDQGIHLLIVDLLPPTRRDPQGIHAAIWDELTGEDYVLPSDKPLTLVSYERDLAIRAYAEHVAVGETLPEMPLFLEPGAHVVAPLQETYETSFQNVPKRWRRVLEATTA